MTTTQATRPVRYARSYPACSIASEVAGTDKCVISVGIPADGAVTLDVAADCRLRGGAGEAVHVMNLMCGLHERTGLALKAIDFNPVDQMVPTPGEEA